MTRRELVALASGIPMPTAAAVDEFSSRKEAMASDVTRAMEARDDLPRLIGEGNEAMMRDNHANHVRYLEGVFHAFDPGLFVEALLWVARTYTAHGFRPEYWWVALPLWRRALTSELSPEAAVQVDPVYAWLEDHFGDVLQLAKSEPTIWEGPPADLLAGRE
ncbi:hypothetical protein [Desulfohalovibrio reitneri]|uniref:hypothetical protein n=1 Tax=Desulfohalovibrio reitneri TaxID=1307759 RepID=UPI000692109F|nr:hypothetical protein [Desulfohalovibrio reitneri]